MAEENGIKLNQRESEMKEKVEKEREEEMEEEMDKFMVSQYPIGTERKMPMPIFYTNHEYEQEWLCRKHGHKSWHYKLLLRIQSNPVQFTLGFLLLLDVLVLVIDLVLQAEFPPEAIVERRCECVTSTEDDHALLLRRLQEDNETCIREIPHVPYDVEVAEDVLFYMSITILLIFEAEFVLLIFLLHDKFFRNVLYLLDFLIVTASVAIEFALKTAAESDISLAILLFVRIWRFVRIGHGIYNDAHELGDHKIRKMKILKKKLEDENIQLRIKLEEANEMISSLKKKKQPQEGSSAESIALKVSST